MSPPLWRLRLTGLDVIEAHSTSERLEESETALAVSLNEIDEATAEWEVLAYFPDEAMARAALDRAGLSGEVKPVPEVDWVRRSLEGLAPVAAGQFFLHGAHDRVRRRPGGISLEIDAGTAFGTGHHQTTMGCLAAFDDLLKASRPRRILDLGCGTGVLALAAAKTCHVAVLASDIDPEAISVSLANARRNGAYPWLRAVAATGVDHPEIRRRAPYDLIFANILAGPLIALAAPLARLAAGRGRIILSGLTRDQERAVMAAYRQCGLVCERRICAGNWVTLVIRRLPNGKRPAA